MLRLKSYITIGAYSFDFVTEVKIKSSWKLLTDTCAIKLPRNVFVNTDKGKRLQDMIKVGDVVKVQYGYDNFLRTEFEGFVSEVRPGIPFEVECQDQMWKLKTAVKDNSWRNVSLKELCEYILKDTGIDYAMSRTVQANLGKFSIKNATGAQVLDQLKKEYGLSAFFRQGRLVIGYPYDPATAKTYGYEIGYNVIDHKLVYQDEKDVKVKIQATAIMGNNQKREVVVGDPDGQVRTLFTVGNLTEKELEAWATEEIKKYRYSGYTGGLKAFGVPEAEHGDIAAIHDGDYPDHSGSFYIDEVTKTFGTNGSRREITLGPKA